MAIYVRYYPAGQKSRKKSRIVQSAIVLVRWWSGLGARFANQQPATLPRHASTELELSHRLHCIEQIPLILRVIEKHPKI